MQEKSCLKCKWLKKYTSEDDGILFWMHVCESDGPEREDEGLYHVTMIDTDEFDPSQCLSFVAKEKA